MTFTFDPTLCCKILPFPIATPPIPFPPLVLNPGVIAALNAQITLLNAYFDAFAFDCPLE